MLPQFMSGSVFVSPGAEDSGSDGFALNLYEGDPWDGCEDIAREDLGEFFDHQLRLNFSCSLRPSVQQANFTKRGLGGLLPFTPSSTSRLCKDCRPSVGSLSVVSTSASLSVISSSSDLSFESESERKMLSTHRLSASPSIPANVAAGPRFERSSIEPLTEEQESENAWRAACSQWDRRGLKEMVWFAAEAEASHVAGSDAVGRRGVITEKCDTRTPGV